MSTLGSSSMLAMAGEHHSEQRCTCYGRRVRHRPARLHRPRAAGPEARSTERRRRRQWRRSSICSLWLRAELRRAVRARSTAALSAAVAQHGQSALGRRSPRGHRRAAPKVRPRAQHCPGLGEVPSPPWRRREAAAARSACPKSPMSVRLAFRRRRLLPEADAACVPLALTRTLGCRPTTGRVCSIAVVSTAPRWRMRAVLAAPPVMGYVVHRCS